MAKAKPQKLGPKQGKWLRMLESGKFKQAKYVLFGGKGYCCLGVACVAEGLEPERIDGNGWEFDGASILAPQSVADALQLHDTDGYRADGNYHLCCVTLNDGGKRFKTIAKHIRAEPEQYFKKPA